MNWKYISGYDNRYKIYENGDVYCGEQKIEPFIHKTLKIPFITLLRGGGHSNSHAIARLVYETFVGKIKDGTILKYKDENNQNFSLNNLEITTRRVKINNGKPIELDNSKIWKPVRGYEEEYKISEYGDLYSIRLNKITSPALSGKGYYRFTLKGKINKNMGIHQIVYMSFKNIQLNKNKVVDHIDRNKTNNHISNLREITNSENAKNKDSYIKQEEKIVQYDLNNGIIKEWDSVKEIIKNNTTYNRDCINRCCRRERNTSYGYVWRYKNYIYDITGFVPLKIDNGLNYSNYKINKNGVVINNCGRQMKQNINEYYSVSLTSDCGKEAGFQVHRLIAINFIPNPNNLPIVNHIDENKLNNEIKNLEWTTAAGNIRHSMGKKVQQIDVNTGKILNTFDCIIDAFKSIRDNQKINWRIGQAASGKSKTAYGYKWKYVE